MLRNLLVLTFMGGMTFCGLQNDAHADGFFSTYVRHRGYVSYYPSQDYQRVGYSRHRGFFHSSHSHGHGCCAPVTCCQPVVVRCCAPPPTCCAPAPTCCAPAPTCCGSSSYAPPATVTQPPPAATEKVAPPPKPEKEA